MCGSGLRQTQETSYRGNKISLSLDCVRLFRISTACRQRCLVSIPGQCVWYMWWTKWHYGRVFPSTLRFISLLSYKYSTLIMLSFTTTVIRKDITTDNVVKQNTFLSSVVRGFVKLCTVFVSLLWTLPEPASKNGDKIFVTVLPTISKSWLLFRYKYSRVNDLLFSRNVLCTCLVFLWKPSCIRCYEKR